MNFEQYKEIITGEVSKLVHVYNSQPILFVGSGMSRRYFNAPNWESLLRKCVEWCPKLDKPFAYYAQSYDSYLDIATHFSGEFKEWAWAGGDNGFPTELFSANTHSTMFFKFKIAEFLSDITPELSQLDSSLCGEINSLKNIRPHAIITTNYDKFFEKVFKDYEPIIFESFLKESVFTIGEIIKIHGCVSSPDSLVITRDDYDHFSRKRKYLSAKLLTYFTEHPIIFLGYSASDPNITSILGDIDEALSMPGELIPNIYFVEWEPEIEKKNPQSEKLLQISDNRSVRVKCIQTDSFSWVYEAFSVDAPLENVNPKLLRAILARSYHLVRSDIPRTNLEVDFSFLEGATESNEKFAKLFGISTLSNPSQVTAKYPYSITDLGKHLGASGWHFADKLIKKVKKEKGFDIKASDNNYHFRVTTGKTKFGKYSQDCLDLLKKVNNGEEYTIES